MALLKALLDTARAKGPWYWVVYLVIACLVILFGFLFWLIYKPPIYTIEQFDVIAPNKTSNSPTTPLIIYDLMFKNKNLHKRIYYDTLNLSFYYNNLSSSSSAFIPVGNAHFGFVYLCPRRSVHRVGQFKPVGLNWENSTADMIFKVKLKVAVRYKSFVSTRYNYVDEAELKVNDQGHLFKGDNNEGIKLDRSGIGSTDIIKGHSFRIWSVLGVPTFILL